MTGNISGVSIKSECKQELYISVVVPFTICEVQGTMVTNYRRLKITSATGLLTVYGYLT